jgi:uncharacterized protein with GYD domain
MAKYLVKACYTTAGAQGLIKDGASKRRAVVEAAMKKIGGKLESFYFAFGDVDAFIVADLPDAVSAAALSVAVNAAGGATSTLVPLLTVEEMDKACKKQSGYTPPGA